MASTEPFALKSPHVWLFFDDAMGKAIHGSQGALEPVNFIFLFMHKPSRSSTVCPPMMPFVAYSFPRPLWESKCRRDTGLVLHCAARQNDFSSPAEALARIELLSRRGSSRDGAPQNACFEGTSVNTFCAASWLPLLPPRFGNATTLLLRGPWIYVAGYNPLVLGPSTHSTALGSSLRPHLGLFAWGSRSKCYPLCLRLST
jgi:hypothetical protein